MGSWAFWGVAPPRCLRLVCRMITRRVVPDDPLDPESPVRLVSARWFGSAASNSVVEAGRAASSTNALPPQWIQLL
jgi:hypothetical protein